MNTEPDTDTQESEEVVFEISKGFEGWTPDFFTVSLKESIDQEKCLTVKL